MTDWEIIDRPPKNRHSLAEDMDYDMRLEAGLLSTLDHGRAIKVPLSRFHCSPAKGRLWKRGFAVRHRVLPDKLSVAAWIEKDPEPEEVYVNGDDPWQQPDLF